jgi:hypothetical protein
MGATSTGIDGVSVARRSGAGWSTYAAIPRSPYHLGAEGLPRWLEPSNDLSRLVFTAAGSFALPNPSNEGGSESIYRADEGGALSWLWNSEQRIANPDPPLGELGVANLLPVGGTPDLTTVYFAYYGTLLPEDKARGEVIQEQGGANEFVRDWGFYEWREGDPGHASTLVNAGELPNKTFDRFGAAPAATVEEITNRPAEFANEVSADGSRSFFVSPCPQTCTEVGCGGEVPELYMRERTPEGTRVVLVSHSELAGQEGQAAPDGPVEEEDLISEGHGYIYASPSGSRVFFASTDQLTKNAPSGGTRMTYMFDAATGAVTYLPDVTGLPVASADDGSLFMFVNTSGGVARLYFWREGRVPGEGQVSEVTSLPTAGGHHLFVGPVRIAAGGRVWVFGTNAIVPNPRGGSFNTGGFKQLYRFVESGTLSCVSCPPAGVAPTGDAHLSSPDAYVRLGVSDVSGVSSDGRRVFFDSPDALVSPDVNGFRDVYEWEDGSVSLISSGSGTANSFFLDNTMSGNDVFFTTAEGLVGADTDGGYDIYDARVGGQAEASAAASCVGECQGEPSTPPTVTMSGGSLSYVGSGNPPVAGGGRAAVRNKPRPKSRSRHGRSRSELRHKARGGARGGRLHSHAAAGVGGMVRGGADS